MCNLSMPTPTGNPTGNIEIKLENLSLNSFHPFDQINYIGGLVETRKL